MKFSGQCSSVRWLCYASVHLSRGEIRRSRRSRGLSLDVIREREREREREMGDEFDEDDDGEFYASRNARKKEVVDDYAMYALMARGRCSACKEWSLRGWSVVPFHTMPCGHQLCQRCVDDTFRQKESATAACTECSRKFRKHELTAKSKEDMLLERACKVRRHVCSKFNKSEIDFDSVEEYHKYVERVEKIIDCTIEGVDLDWVDEQMRANEAQNQSIAARNRSNNIQRMSVWKREVLAERLGQVKDMMRFLAEDAISYKRATQEEKEDWDEFGIETLRRSLVSMSEKSREMFAEHGLVLPSTDEVREAAAKADARAALVEASKRNDAGKTKRLSTAALVKQLKNAPYRVRRPPLPQPAPKDGSKRLPRAKMTGKVLVRKKRRKAGGFNRRLVLMRTRHEMFTAFYEP